MAHHISKSVSMGWLNLDAWSETYVGAHWLVTDELPAKQYQSLPRHGPLSQMVLLSAHHLVEVMFFQCVRVLIRNSPSAFANIDATYDKKPFKKAFTQWPVALVGSPFDTSQQPLKSVLSLADRRNATIHKESALSSLEMARSALYSAVHASKAIAEHLLGSGGFKYTEVLLSYPLTEQQWFSEVTFVDEVS